MNITFNYFKQKYPGKIKFKALTTEQLAFVKDNFPEDLYLFLEEEGYCSYGDSFFHFVDPDDYTDVLAEWDKPTDGHLVFFRTGIGDLFTWNQNEISVLHVNSGLFESISENMFDFFKFSLGDQQFVNNTLYKELFDKAMKKAAPLKYDECLAFVPALPMGGTESADNLQKSGIKEYLSMLAQLHT